MKLYLTILEGRTPRQARPLLATEDQEIIAKVLEELVARLTPGVSLRAYIARTPDRSTPKPADGIHPYASDDVRSDRADGDRKRPAAKK